MARLVRKYDIYLPLRYNDGVRIERQKFLTTENELLRRFGGFTAIRQEHSLRGFWEEEGQLYIDEVIIITVLDFASDLSEDERFFENYKSVLKERFQQREVLITFQDLNVI